MNKVYSFEFLYPEPYKQEWHISTQRLGSIEKAAEEAAEWMKVCFINDMTVTVRIVELEA